MLVKGGFPPEMVSDTVLGVKVTGISGKILNKR